MQNSSGYFWSFASPAGELRLLLCGLLNQQKCSNYFYTRKMCLVVRCERSAPRQVRYVATGICNCSIQSVTVQWKVSPCCVPFSFHFKQHRETALDLELHACTLFDRRQRQDLSTLKAQLSSLEDAVSKLQVQDVTHTHRDSIHNSILDKAVHRRAKF